MWKTIGTELGVNTDTLNDIEKDNTDDDDRLYAVIDSAAPTREIMAKILESANISNAIAGMIKLPPPFSPPLKLFVAARVGWDLHTLWLADALHQSGVC